MGFKGVYIARTCFPDYETKGGWVQLNVIDKVPYAHSIGDEIIAETATTSEEFIIHIADYIFVFGPLRSTRVF